jgi:hypothetical protein
MHYENPKLWAKALKRSMAQYILSTHADGKTSNSHQEFEIWKKDHESLLGRFGRYAATRLARMWWRRLVKKLSRPAEDEAQQFLEGMEVFRNVDRGFASPIPKARGEA